MRIGNVRSYTRAHGASAQDSDFIDFFHEFELGSTERLELMFWWKVTIYFPARSTWSAVRFRKKLWQLPKWDSPHSNSDYVVKNIDADSSELWSAEKTDCKSCLQNLHAGEKTPS
jgi:hypothetical protein